MDRAGLSCPNLVLGQDIHNVYKELGICFSILWVKKSGEKCFKKTEFDQNCTQILETSNNFQKKLFATTLQGNPQTQFVA